MGSFEAGNAPPHRLPTQEHETQPMNSPSELYEDAADAETDPGDEEEGAYAEEEDAKEAEADADSAKDNYLTWILIIISAAVVIGVIVFAIYLAITNPKVAKVFRKIAVSAANKTLNDWKLRKVANKTNGRNATNMIRKISLEVVKHVNKTHSNNTNNH